MAHENLKARTFDFSVATVSAVRHLLRDPLGRYLAGQLIRSSASVGSNYIAACHAQSRKDFASKISIVAEEAAESAFWFEMFVATGLIDRTAVQPLIIEAKELASIATTSARTARRRQTS